MASSPGYTIVSNTKSHLHYNITIILDFWQQVDLPYSL